MTRDRSREREGRARDDGVANDRDVSLESSVDVDARDAASTTYARAMDVVSEIASSSALAGALAGPLGIARGTEATEATETTGASARASEGGAADDDDDDDDDDDAGTRALENQGRVVSLLASFERGTPMMALFLMIFFYKHFAQLAFVGWLTYALLRANGRTVAEVAKREARKVADVGGVIVALLAHLLVVWTMTPTGRRARGMFQEPAGFWTCAFDVAALDLCARYAFIVAKLLIVALPMHVLQRVLRISSKAAAKMPTARVYRRRASLLSTVEYANAACRTLIPAPVWLAYFKRELPSLFASFVTGLYVVFKLRGVVQRGFDFINAASTWLTASKRAGDIATREDLMEAGDVCAICREPCVDATKLRCSHIFCEDCIGEWFDRQPSRGASREKTCPVCRAVVHSGTLKSFGDGSTQLSPLFF